MQTNKNKNSNFFERLMLFASKMGISSINELSSKLGYNSPEKLYRLKRDHSARPSYDILNDISNMFETIDMNWLISGKGDAFKKIENRVSEPSAKYHDTKMPTVVTVNRHGNDNVVMVPVKARAGYLLGFADPEFISELPSYSFPGIRGGTFRAFEVDGQSMTPTLKNGDFVISEWVENFNLITDDRVYVIVTHHDGILVKRVLNRIDKYGFILAKSDSISNREMYPNITISPDDINEIWYVKSYLSSDLASPSDIYNRINDLETSVEYLKSQIK